MSDEGAALGQTFCCVPNFPASVALGMSIKMRRNHIFLYFFILSNIICLAVNPSDGGSQAGNADDTIPIEIFGGRWKTGSGALYEYINGKMFCISVQAERDRRWVNQVALKNFRIKNRKWYADQAIRYQDSMKLSKWMTAEIQIVDQSTFLKIVLDMNYEISACCRPQLWTKVQ